MENLLENFIKFEIIYSKMLKILSTNYEGKTYIKEDLKDKIFVLKIKSLEIKIKCMDLKD